MLLKNYYAPFLTKSRIFSAVLDSLQVEHNNIDNMITDIVNQCFIDTATWGLKYWEEMLNIPIDESKPYDFRRSVIKAKIRGTGTITVNLVDTVADSFSNGEVNIIERPETYSFTVKFVGERGIPANLDDFKKVIEELKPAHLNVIYEFTYTVWGEVKNTTWGNVKTGTWGQLKTRLII